MLKTVFLSGILLVGSITSANSSEYWEGCASTKNAATSALAQNILVKVDSTFTSQEKSSFFSGFESTSEESKSSKSLSSTMFLTDVQIEKKDGEFCARVNKEKLHTFTQNKHKHLDKDYMINSLSNDQKIKAKTIDGWLSSLTFLKGLTEVFSDLNMNKINEKVAKLQNIRKTLHLQTVTIDVRSYSKERYILKIAEKRYDLSKPIYLEAKEYTFTISSPNICTYSGKFTLKKEEDFQETVNMNGQAFPKFIISANKSRNVTFRFDGKDSSLGKPITLNECSGEVNYRLDYSEGLPESIVKNIKLKAGLTHVKSYSFSSDEEIKQLNELSRIFNSGERLEVGYTKSIISKDVIGNKEYDNFDEYRITYIRNKNWLRYGTSIAYSKGDKDSYGAELSFIGALQLTTFGAKDNSLMLFNSIVLVPYLGLQVGGAYLKSYNKTSTDYDIKFEYENTHRNNYMVLRYIGGLDIVFSKQMALGLRYSKDEYLLKSDNFGAYISLKL